MKIIGKLILWCLMACALCSRAEEPTPSPKVEELEGIVEKEAAAPANTLPSAPSWHSILAAPKGDEPLLTVGARFDTAFSMGGAVSQGFSIPSFRLTAFGEPAKWIHYRMSAGQTREFSSAMLPQLAPVEAYVDLGAERVLDENGLRWRIGLFTPTFNSWWSPDLSDLTLPDYNASHRRLFLSRDIGTEIVMGVASGLSLFVGAFNGNGIYGINTNSSRAFTGGARYDFNWDHWKFSVTAAAYTAYQSTPSSVNYRANTMADLSLLLKNEWLTVGVDAMVGTIREYLVTANPFGASLFADIELSKSIHAFGRFEAVQKMPTSNYTLNHFQFGPQLLLGEYIRAFLLYDYSSDGTGAENTFLARVRVNL